MKSRKTNIRFKIILSLIFGVFLFGGIAVLAYLSQNDIDNRNRAADLNNTILVDQFPNKESIYIEIQSNIQGLDPILYNSKGDIVQKYDVIYPNKSGLYTFSTGILKPSDNSYYVHFVPHCEGRICISEPTFTSKQRLVTLPQANLFFSDDGYCDSGIVSFYTQNATRDWLKYTITDRSGTVVPILPPIAPIDGTDNNVQSDTQAVLPGPSIVVQQDLSECAGAKKCPVDVSKLKEGTNYEVKVAYCKTKWTDCTDLAKINMKTRSCKQLSLQFSNYSIPSKAYKSESFDITAQLKNNSSFASGAVTLTASIIKKNCSENCNVFQKTYNITNINSLAQHETIIPVTINSIGKYSVSLLAVGQNSRDMISTPIYAYGETEIIEKPVSCNLTCPTNQIPNSDCTACICNLSCQSPLVPNNSCTSCICNKACPTNYAPSDDCTKCVCALECPSAFKVNTNCTQCVCKTACATGYKQNSDCSCTKIVKPVDDDDDDSNNDDDSNQYSYTPTSSQDTATTSDDATNTDSDQTDSSGTTDKAEESKGVDIVPLLVIPLVVLLLLGLLLIPFLVKKKGPSWN